MMKMYEEEPVLFCRRVSNPLYATLKHSKIIHFTIWITDFATMTMKRKIVHVFSLKDITSIVRTFQKSYSNEKCELSCTRD